MSGLEIPQRAYNYFYTTHDQFTVVTAAPIIVATKLRQLADFYTDSWPAPVRAQLRNEADELGPEGATR